jgi:hypothetical protein
MDSATTASFVEINVAGEYAENALLSIARSHNRPGTIHPLKGLCLRDKTVPMPYFGSLKTGLRLIGSMVGRSQKVLSPIAEALLLKHADSTWNQIKRTSMVNEQDRL